MRFAYIDSQGKEVGIPSVDALRLRIALKAITADTVFFDGSTERWAPAGEHDIFRTLKKELDEQEEGTFVAPPPPATDEDPGALNADALEVEANAESPDATTGDEAAEDWRFQISNSPSARDEAEEDSTGSAPPEDGPQDPTKVEPVGTSSWLEVDGDENDPVFNLEESEFVDSEPEEDGPDRFDLVPEFGGPDPDDVEVEDALPEEEAPEEVEQASAAPEASGPAEPPSAEAGPEEGGETEAVGATVEPGVVEGFQADRFDFEGVLEESGWGDEPPPAEDELEEGDEAQEGSDEDLGLVDATAEAVASAAGGDDLPLPTREELARRPDAPRPSGAGGGVPPGSRKVRAGPPPPRRPRRRGLGAAPVVGVVLVLGVAGAGWWMFGRGGAPAEEAAPAPPPVAIPDVPAELEPRVRELGSQVRAASLEALRGLPARMDVPAEPSQEWLGGSYMANASRYGDVQRYWSTMDGFLRDMQAAEDSIFAAELSSHMASAALPPDTAKLLQDRILAGFRATARERGAVYQQARGVAEAALRLHTFLVENEPSIDYEPAAGGISRDPVLEAVPATPELGEEMWDRVGEITRALDSLDFLDRVTTQRLVDAITAKLERIELR